MDADITFENSNAENTIPISVSLMSFPFALGGKKGIKNASVVIAINCTVRTTNVRVLSFHGEFMDESDNFLSIAYVEETTVNMAAADSPSVLMIP